MIERALHGASEVARAPRRCPRWTAAAPCERTVRGRALQLRLARDPDARSPLTWALRPPTPGEWRRGRRWLAARAALLTLLLAVEVALRAELIAADLSLLLAAPIGVALWSLPRERRLELARARWEQSCFCPRHRVVFVPGEPHAAPLGDVRPLLWFQPQSEQWDSFVRQWHAEHDRRPAGDHAGRQPAGRP